MPEGKMSAAIQRALRREAPERTAPARAVEPESTVKSEREFRNWFYLRHLQRAHVSLGLALALVLITACIDLISAPDTLARWSALIKLSVICPLPFITLWVSRQPRWRHLFPHFMCASIVSVGVAFSVINLGAGGVGIELRYDSLLLVTVFAYFLGGLASHLACLTGLILLGGYVAASFATGVVLTQIAYEGLFLLAVNAIGMLSANNMELSVREAFARAQAVSNLSELDPLTGLLNRRGFVPRFEAIWSQAIREEKSLAVAMIDLDHFKHVNDRHGHAAGDMALRTVADVLASQATRPLDVSVRWGGEEFVVVWYDVKRSDAQKLAERVRSGVEDLRFSNEIGGRKFLTVSIGAYTCRPKPTLKPEDCLHYADQAQYQAKQGGRNSVVVI